MKVIDVVLQTNSVFERIVTEMAGVLFERLSCVKVVDVVLQRNSVFEGLVTDMARIHQDAFSADKIDDDWIFFLSTLTSGNNHDDRCRRANWRLG